MNSATSLEQLLRWRLDRAEQGAPPPPRAARLLEISRPWWEVWPEKFRAATARVCAIQAAYGHAATSHSLPTEHPVPTLIVRPDGEIETSARLLYWRVDDDALRLRFQLEPAAAQGAEAFEVTFVSPAGDPLLVARATLSVENEFRLDGELPSQTGTEWKSLRVADRMPFRFILRPLATAP